MKRALLVGLLLAFGVAASGCLMLEDATRQGSVLMTRRVNARLDAPLCLSAEQETAFGNAFFDQAQEDYKLLEDWLKTLKND